MLYQSLFKRKSGHSAYFLWMHHESPLLPLATPRKSSHRNWMVEWSSFHFWCKRAHLFLSDDWAPVRWLVRISIGCHLWYLQDIYLQYVNTSVQSWIKYLWLYFQMNILSLCVSVCMSVIWACVCACVCCYARIFYGVKWSSNRSMYVNIGLLYLYGKIQDTH